MSSDRSITQPPTAQPMWLRFSYEQAQSRIEPKPFLGLHRFITPLMVGMSNAWLCFFALMLIRRSV